MLEPIKSGKYWQWGAYGKHPVAKDFFQFGEKLPLIKSFSGWVEKGYKVLASKRNAGHGHFSWRFWTKGARKGIFVCGLVRDSSDGLGRPYPLLIMGTGPLKDWEDQWDLLPYACEETWNQIEYVSAQVFKDFRRLEVEIQNIRPPYPAWSEFKRRNESSMKFGLNADDENSSRYLNSLESETSRLSKKLECIVFLDDKQFLNQFMLISYWHFLFKAHLTSIPNALFMGGTIEEAYLVLFKRPLIYDDFIKLWSVSSLEKNLLR